LRAAKAAHLPCQVYEGKEKEAVRKTTKSFRHAAAKACSVPTVAQRAARRIPSLDPTRLAVAHGDDKSDKT
jgi:hypothetical protein